MCAVEVFCRAGVHRRVSMMIALGDELKAGYGLQVEMKHLTLERTLEEREMERSGTGVLGGSYGY